jgi:hypothetical protein
MKDAKNVSIILNKITLLQLAGLNAGGKSIIGRNRMMQTAPKNSFCALSSE